MNVASKKRGIFSRGSKTLSGGSSLGGNATSSTSINENNQDENNKINKPQSSPSSTSHQFNEIDEDRFNGDGVQFQGKLIGHEYVAEARGEQMCQQSLKKLKIIQKALGGHKRKINLFISFDGIKIMDPQTNEQLFHHSVPQISFISRDETDVRAFGYVFGNSQTGHQFIGIKTKKEAMIIMSTIGQLFAITLKRKRNAEQEQASSAILNAGTEHLYHSVPDPISSQVLEIGNNNNDLSLNANATASTKSRARLRPNTGVSMDNVPIPALPPPSDQHPRHRQQQSLQQNQRFATIGRVNDINNNFSQQQKNLSHTLINELDLFQPLNANDQNLSLNIDSSLSKDKIQAESGNQPLAASYDWAHFDDDYNQLSVKDDSTMNTISSISDTLTFGKNQQTLDDSVTLVAGQQQQQYSTNQKFQMNTKTSVMNSQNKLNSSSTTISSANFDGMDPFSDAFGSDPFSTASTTADISSNVFSIRASQQVPQQIRPPSNPGPNTMFDSNKLSFKVINSGSVPALTNTFGSLSLNKSQQSIINDQNSNTLVKSNVELSHQNQNSQADKYAVLADINNISTSIFDSLGNNQETIMKKNNKTPTPPPPATTLTQQHNQFTGLKNNLQKQPNSSPLLYGINGVVVLPPVSSSSSITITNEHTSIGNFTKNQWLTKSFDLNENTNNQNINLSQQQLIQKQAPRAEFDSMSNLSLNSSNNSISNINQQQNSKKLAAETANVPLFEELDPLNKNNNILKRNSPLNFGNSTDNRNKSPLLNNPSGLESSLSSMNSSNSSLFNNSHNNCSTPNSLQQQQQQQLQQNRKSPQQLLNHQHSLPVLDSKSQFLKVINNNNNNKINNNSSISNNNNNNNKIEENSKNNDVNNENFIDNENISHKITEMTNKSITTKSPHYIVLYDLSTSPSQSNQINNENWEKVTVDKNNNKDNDKDEYLSNLNKHNDYNDDDNKKSNDSLSTNIVQNDKNKNNDEDNSLSDNKNNNKENDYRSRTSSISSSSNSLLLQQENSNFSELKFDDVFETPLLINDDKEQKIIVDEKNESIDRKLVENKIPTIDDKQKTTTTSSIKSRTESISSIKSSSSTGMKHQTTSVSLSRQSSTSSTPPAIPPRTDLHNNSNKYHSQISAIAPPLPPPHSQIHSSYGNRMYPHQQYHQHSYPAIPYPYYPSPPPTSNHYSDPYMHRPNSSSSQHHHRYHPSYYDSWYCNQTDPIYAPPPLRPPLDYPPQIPPPPIPANVSPNYLGYHGNSNDYYMNSTRPTTNSWHEYYQQQQFSHHPSSHQPMTSSSLSLSSTTSGAQYISQQQEKQPIKSSSRSSSPPISNIENEDTVPNVPNPQRRISATSVSSSLGGAISGQSTSSNLQRTSSTVSNTTDRTYNSNIPMFPHQPPPPQHQMDSFYPLPIYDDPNKSTASSFAAFNLNMEQMMMKYHHPVLPSVAPTHHHRNSPMLPPYESPYGYANYHSYPLQYPPMVRNNRNNYYNQLDIAQQHQQLSSSPLPSTSSQSGTLLPGVAGSTSPFGCTNNNVESNSSSSGYASTMISTTSMIDPIARISPAHHQYINYHHHNYQNPWATTFSDNKTQQDNNTMERIDDKNKTKESDLSFKDDFANFDINQNGFDTIKKNQKESLILMFNEEKNDNIQNNGNNNNNNEIIVSDKKMKNIQQDSNTEQFVNQSIDVKNNNENQLSTNSNNKNNNNNDDNNKTNRSQEYSSSSSSSSTNQMDIFNTKNDPFEDDFFKT